jgi:hypothetical protein
VLCSLRASWKSIVLYPTFGRMTHKLDLFAVLGLLDENELSIYSTLKGDADMLKEFEQAVGWLLPHWMTGSNSESDLVDLTTAFNEYCNGGWFALREHPDLQAKLLACCGLGSKTRHKFFKPKKDKVLTRISNLLKVKYPDIRDEEVLVWCRLNDKKDVQDLAEAWGYQKDEVKKVLDSYKKVMTNGS